MKCDLDTEGEYQMPESNEPVQKRGFMELVGRAVMDPEIREKLFSDPDSLARQYGLSPGDTEALKGIDRAKLEEAAAQVSNRPDFTIAIFVRIHF
jgi:hypothetical protein